ncbi:MAG: RNA polymerase sigma factor [Caulobacteraceae bacterium]|nr:RNA polymerase sigma factor [Caulobacteraceae bacterium]
MAEALDPGEGRERAEGAAPDLAAWMVVYGGRLRRYFARRAPPDDADDLVQDVFLRLQSAARRPPIGNVERYLFAVAHNVLISQRRTRALRRWSQHDALESAPELSSELSPERILVGRQEYERLIRVVATLPPRARAAFRLHRLEDMTSAAIAQRMGISRESVKELLHRASVYIDRAMGVKGGVV